MVKETKEIAKWLWTFPGWTMELDENIFECAKREAKEESGLDIEPKFLLHINSFVNNFTWNNVTVFVFLSEIIWWEIQTSEEHPEVEFKTLEEIENLNKEWLIRQPWLIKIIKDIPKYKKDLDLIEIINICQ